MRNLLYTLLGFNILALGITLYVLVALSGPDEASLLFPQLEQKYQENRKSIDPDVLRHHYDNLWSAYAATEKTLTSVRSLQMTYTIVAVCLIFSNLILIIKALKAWAEARSSIHSATEKPSY